MVVGNKKVEGMEFFSLWRKIHLFIYAHTVCIFSKYLRSALGSAPCLGDVRWT